MGFWTPQPQMQMMLQILLQMTRQIPKRYSFHQKGDTAANPSPSYFLLPEPRGYTRFGDLIYISSQIRFPNVSLTHADPGVKREMTRSCMPDAAFCISARFAPADLDMKGGRTRLIRKSCVFYSVVAVPISLLRASRYIITTASG